MRYQKVTLGGDQITIATVEDASDLRSVVDLVTHSRTPLAFDTETSGLNVFHPSFRVRLVQIATTPHTAFVIPVEGLPQNAAAVREIFSVRRQYIAHHMAFDCLVMDRHLGVPLDVLMSQTCDTQLLSHLVDPRGRKEGAIDHGLKEQSVARLAADADACEKELKALFRKGYDWATVPLLHPVFTAYAGMDPILTLRLWHKLRPLLRVPEHLVEFEHAFALTCARMERRGLRIDKGYLRQLSRDLEAKAGKAADQAAREFGIASLYNKNQVAEALLKSGVPLTARTDSGQWQITKEILQDLADVDDKWEPRHSVEHPNRLALLVLEGKRADKWRTGYVEAMLEKCDADGRVHPSIKSLQARTGRTSASGPALHQLPSKDATIRRGIIPDAGSAIGSVDQKAVELRVLAALADEPTMKAAIRAGKDLHDFTAETMFGPGFTPQQRKLAKVVGLGKVFGGGVGALMRQTGQDQDTIVKARNAYDQTYPGIRRFAKRLQAITCHGTEPVVTTSGRRLPLDRDRAYAAVNYAVQSTARDCMAYALMKAEAAGLGEYLLLPVHDEVIFQAPIAEAGEVAAALGRELTTEIFGVRLDTDPEVYGPSWGHGYGATK